MNNDNFDIVWNEQATRLVEEWINRGWELHYLNILFKHLDPQDGPCMDQMRHWIEDRFYPRLCGEFAHHFRKEAYRVPKMVLYPDKHVWKKNHKISRYQLGLEDRIHFNGPIMINLDSRLKQNLVELVQKKQAKLAIGKIARVHILPITYAKGRVVDYSGKTVRRGRADESDIIVLPKPISDLTQRPVLLDPDARLVKDLVSRLNVSEENARAMIAQQQNRCR